MVEVIFSFQKNQPGITEVSLITNINNYCDIQKMKYFYCISNTYIQLCE